MWKIVLVIEDEKILRAFGKKLREIREGKNLSQEKLGYAADSFQSTIIRIEQGKSNPKLTTIISLAKALDIDVRELFDFER